MASEHDPTKKISSGLVIELKSFLETDTLGSMDTLKKSSANQNMLVRVEAALLATMTEVLKQGFFGTARLELRISDGTIQAITSSVERIEKRVRRESTDRVEAD